MMSDDYPLLRRQVSYKTATPSGKGFHRFLQTLGHSISALGAWGGIR